MRTHIGAYKSEEDMWLNFVMWPEDASGQCGVAWICGRVYFGDISFFTATVHESYHGVDEEVAYGT